LKRIEEFLARLPVKSKYFTLLLAWDAPNLPLNEIVDLVRPLVSHGLVYFCAWGDNCELAHDAVDRADIERMRIEDHEDYVIMTTWHHEEALEEVFWFFDTLAIPTEDQFSSDLERFAVAIGKPGWVDRMKRPSPPNKRGR
jgi:hypothetical protein